MTRRILGAFLLALAVPGGGTGRAAEPAAKVEFVTLGTGGGPVIRLKRSQPANALVVGEDVYLFDVGEGVERQLVAAGLALPRVRAIFISHHHLDHDAGLGPLLARRWLFNNYAPLPVHGPPGTADMVTALARAYRPVELAPIMIGGPAKPGIDSTVAVKDLPAALPKPTLVYRDEKVRVLAVENAHYHFPAGTEARAFSRSYSFRIEAGGRVIVYTGDTGPSPGLERLAQGADLLVSEIIDLEAMEVALRRASDLPAAAMGPILAHMKQDHLTPEQVGALAAKAGVGKVVLTHLAPGLDQEPAALSYSKGVGDRFTGPVVVANDLDRF